MMRHIAAAHGAQPRHAPAGPLWLTLVAFVILTIFFAWLDRIEREYTAELTAEALARRLRPGGQP